jgi:hypothetical protein
MWQHCSPALDAPVMKWCMELDDVLILGMLVVVVPFLASLVKTLTPTDGVVFLVIWGSLCALLYFGKRGKPRGYLLHWFREMQLIPLPQLRLPGLLMPRPTLYKPW